MQAANGMRDMALVHQIVVDKDFKLKRAEPKPNSVQRLIKDTVHKTFWDALKEELAETPPNYTQVGISFTEDNFLNSEPEILKVIRLPDWELCHR